MKSMKGEIMKKFIAVFFVLFSVTTFAQDYDRFGGVWKHHFIQAERITFRISFKEAKSPATYGESKGTRFGYKLYIDAWGQLGFKSVDYNFLSMDDKSGIEREYDGTLIKENYGHQYDRLTPGDEYFHLQGNEDFKHLLRIRIGEKTYQFFLEL